MYYHIKVEFKDGSKHTEIKGDVEKKVIISKYAIPYVHRKPFILNGVHCKPKEIERLNVYQSEVDFPKLLNKAKIINTQSNNIDGNLILGCYISDNERALGLAMDITDDILTEAEHGHSNTVTSRQAPKPQRVFIVHGHDLSLRDSLASFLRELGLKPIILQDEPDQGKTIIEKFEDMEEEYEISYAFILLSPDDVAAKKKKLSIFGKLKSRPRQNVILEWGYFMKGLGRDKICIIRKGDMELPSDIDGVVYKPVVETIEEIQPQIREELIRAGVLRV